MRRNRHGAHATARHAPAAPRSTTQRLSAVGAIVLGAAPIGIGLVRAWNANGDYRMFWMAIAASLFAAGTLVAAIGRRRSHRAVKVQAIAIAIVSTMLAAAAAYVFGATAWFGIWAVALAFGACLAAASVLVAVAGPRTH